MPESQTLGNERGAAPFRPYRIRSLSVSNHVVLLFCVLLNVYAGWHFFSPTLDNGWGDFDDDTWRRDTRRRNTVATIFDPFLTTGHEAMDTSYVPVQSYIYHFSANVVGQEAWPIRVLGIWVHILNSILILVIAFRFTGSVPGAHLASLAFLIYPRNVSTIGWLCASLAHGLVLFLYLMAFILMQTFLHRSREKGSSRWGWWRLALALLLFIVALLTKELSATLFAALLLYDVIVVVGVRSLWPPKLKTLLGLAARHGPFLAVLVGAVVIQKLKYETGFVHTKFGGMEFGARNPIRLLELVTLFFHWGPKWSPEINLWVMAGVYGALMAGIWLSRKNGPLLFLLLWMPLILTPFTISNFRDVQSLGRYLYECSAVLAIVVSLLAVRLARWRPQLQYPTLCFGFVLLAYFASSIPRIIS